MEVHSGHNEAILDLLLKYWLPHSSHFSQLLSMDISRFKTALLKDYDKSKRNLVRFILQTFRDFADWRHPAFFL